MKRILLVFAIFALILMVGSTALAKVNYNHFNPNKCSNASYYNKHRNQCNRYNGPYNNYGPYNNGYYYNGPYNSYGPYGPYNSYGPYGPYNNGYYYGGP